MSDTPPTSPVASQAGSAAGDSHFPQTQWSIVARAGLTAGGDASSRRALEELCRRYWLPIYAFVRRQGRPHHEAEDAVQSFFAHLIQTEGLRLAQAERGRFRTFLLTSLRNHMTSAWRHDHAQRRGGATAHVALDLSSAEDRYAREPADPALTPEQAYDRAWAAGLIRQATEIVRRDFEKSGRGHVFAAIHPLLHGEIPAGESTRRAAEAGLTSGAFHVTVHRARRRLAEAIRELVAQTVADPADVEAEIRHLIQALA